MSYITSHIAYTIYHKSYIIYHTWLFVMFSKMWMIYDDMSSFPVGVMFVFRKRVNFFAEMAPDLWDVVPLKIVQTNISNPLFPWQKKQNPGLYVSEFTQSNPKEQIKPCCMLFLIIYIYTII